MRCEICDYCETTNSGLDQVTPMYGTNRVRYNSKTKRDVCDACLSIEGINKRIYEMEGPIRPHEGANDLFFLENNCTEDIELIDTEEDVHPDAPALSEV